MSTTEVGTGFAALCAAVQETLGIQLEGYRSRQLDRRLAFFRQRHGLTTNAALAIRLRRDQDFRQLFADFLTINVTEFFRNADRFESLRERYLPLLLSRRQPLRIWSAGCSAGAEAYSVAMLLQELTPGTRHYLLGTDIDAASLQRARAAIYPAQEVREVSAPMRKRLFAEHSNGYQLSAAVRSQVEFKRHDLMGDDYPGDLDLILCRNVVIYFTEETKRGLYRRFHSSLRPGGVLFIGATESILDARTIGLRYLEPCFYERLVTG